MTKAPRLAIAAALSAASAAAEPSDLTLAWAAPPGCPTGDAVRARVETLLGAPVAHVARGPVGVSGVVRVDGSGAELVLETQVPGSAAAAGPVEPVRGERRLRGATCDEVTAAGALVVALAIDPKAVEATSAKGATAAFESAPAAAAPSSSPPPPAPAPVPSPVLPPATAPPPPASDAPRTEGRLDARVVADFGTLPGPSLGAGLGAGFSVGRFTARLEGEYFFPRFARASTPAPDGAARGANVSLVAFDAEGCYAAVPGEVELDVCAVLEPGALVAVGSHLERTTSAIKAWLAAGGTAEIVVRALHPLTIRAGGGALVPFGRSRVNFTQISETSTSLVDLDRPGPVSGRAFLGAGLSF